ncbi:response regulator transcription factor [Meiothermus sp. CFH 77666]|uniref:response regulator transcription factor n=1 Tax=Meiothermus sp. CFH 77666 TaxID=2817942 RepID=UPI001AA09C4D|nr:response regulator transcription factor [Meiothermus sp. CFH 77666]MBO1438540.1 response regulator transcription factor [Meiothermus sp. CFH 77666]
MGIKVVSGSRIITEAFERLVMELDFSNSLTLVVDHPVGVALHLLPELRGSSLVLTASYSPYYLADLLEHQPGGIVQEPLQAHELREALERVARGQTIWPDVEDTLPPQMRRVLRALVSGMCHQSIADTLQLSLKRVYNIVSDLKFYLGAETQADLLLKYLGLAIKPPKSQGKNSREFFPSQPPDGSATLLSRKEVKPVLRELTQEEAEQTLGGAVEQPPSLPWLARLLEEPCPWPKPVVPIPRPVPPEERE